MSCQLFSLSCLIVIHSLDWSKCQFCTFLELPLIAVPIIISFPSNLGPIVMLKLRFWAEETKGKKDAFLFPCIMRKQVTRLWAHIIFLRCRLLWFLPAIIQFLPEVAELQLQLSPDLLKMMEQRLSAIEQRSACLQNLIDRVNAACICIIFFWILYYRCLVACPKFLFYPSREGMKDILWGQLSALSC